MFNYAELGIDNNLKIALDELSLNSDHEMLYFLEQYKYFNRQQLLDFLRKQKSWTIESIENYTPSVGYREIEEKYNVVVVADGKSTIKVCYDCTAGFDEYGLSLEIQFNSIMPVFVALTPYNFEELLGKPRKQFQPIQLLRRILILALDKHATDVHFEVRHTSKGVEYPVLFRIDGDLVENTLFQLSKYDNNSMIGSLVEKKTSSNSLDLLNSAGITTSTSGIPNDETELRISANRVRDGYHYVIRIQQKTTVSFHINELGFCDDVMNALYDMTEKRSGITFITGAIRTGKNTTAFAMANGMCKQPIKIVSYESPIEVLMPFPQNDYQESTEMLLDAIRLAKKQDINVAFINEIPTKEVAFAVQDLVNSSVHVITTMHMNRVWHLPYKLKEYYGNDYKDVLSQINAVFNQKMFAKACPFCRNQILSDSIENDSVREFVKARGVDFVWKNVGCEQCNKTGIKKGSNQPYAEFIVFTDSLVTKLLKCENPSDMELILRDEAKKTSLEGYMLNAVKAGELPYRNLINVI